MPHPSHPHQANQAPRPLWQIRSLRWGGAILAIWLLFALVSWLTLPGLIKKTAIEQT